MTSTLSPMNPQRRAAVRAALVEHVATTAHPAAPGPRPRRRPVVRRSLLAAVPVAAVAVTVTVMVAADPAAPPSYATWTAVPATAPGGAATEIEIRTWASTCTDLGVGGIRFVEGFGARPEDAATRKALVDRRGDFTYCVDIALGSGTPGDPFIAVSGLRADDLNRMWGTTTDKPVQPPAGGDVIVAGGDDSPIPEDEPGVRSLRAYQLYGMAGPDVTGVDILLGNGLRVTATVQDGVWGAWWPVERGAPTGSRLAIHTAEGTRTVPTDSVRLPI
jgi:hypothetical protein